MANKGILKQISEDSVLIISFDKEKKNRIYFLAKEFDQIYKTKEYSEFIFEDAIFYIFDHNYLEKFKKQILEFKFSQLISSNRKKILNIYIKRYKKDDFQVKLYYYFTIPVKWRKKIEGKNFYILMSKIVFIVGTDKEQLWELYKKMNEF